jgi:hypothetical protein
LKAILGDQHLPSFDLCLGRGEKKKGGVRNKGIGSFCMKNIYNGDRKPND